MSSIITLKPEDLFFLAEQMKAAYISYDYIAAMPDIQKRYHFLRRQAMVRLEKSGILTENFRGEITIQPGVRQVLEPVFFGKTESTLSIIDQRKDKKVKICKLHHHQGRMTMVMSESGSLRLAPVRTEDIGQMVRSIADGFVCRESIKSRICSDRITRIVLAKAGTVGVGTRECCYLEQDGVLLRDDGSNLASGVSRREFTDQICNILGGK